MISRVAPDSEDEIRRGEPRGGMEQRGDAGRAPLKMCRSGMSISRQDRVGQPTCLRAASSASGAISRKESSVRCVQRPRHRRERALVRAAARGQRRRLRTSSFISSGRAPIRSSPPSSGLWRGGERRRAAGGDCDLGQRPDCNSIENKSEGSEGCGEPQGERRLPELNGKGSGGGDGRRSLIKARRVGTGELFGWAEKIGRAHV